MASTLTSGHGPLLFLKRAFGLARKPAAPARPAVRAAAYDDFFALQNRKDPRPAPKK